MHREVHEGGRKVQLSCEFERIPEWVSQGRHDIPSFPKKIVSRYGVVNHARGEVRFHQREDGANDAALGLVQDIVLREASYPPTPQCLRDPSLQCKFCCWVCHQVIVSHVQWQVCLVLGHKVSQDTFRITLTKEL